MGGRQCPGEEGYAEERHDEDLDDEHPPECVHGQEEERELDDPEDGEAEQVGG